MENNSSNPVAIIGIGTQVTMFSMLFALSLVGNVLVIAVVFWNLDMRTNFNYLIVNMAMSDLIIPLIALPINISQLVAETSDEWFVDGQLGNILCKLCFFLADISPVVSVVSLVIIAINRYLAVSYSVPPRLARRVVNRILIAFTWIVAIVLFSPWLFSWHTTKKDGRIECTNDWNAISGGSPLSFRFFIGAIVVVSFIIPSISVVILYSLIIYRLRENSRNMSTMLQNKQLETRKRKNKQITYISLLIMVAFILLWGPFYVFLSLIYLVWQQDDIPQNFKANFQIIRFVVIFLAYSNSAINPCIYFSCLKNYRQGLICLLCRVRKRRNSQSFETRSNRFSKLRNQTSMRNQQRTSVKMVSGSTTQMVTSV